MLPSFETERLILRPLRLDDASAIQQHFPHWEIVKFMNGAVPWPYPADGALQFLQAVVMPNMAKGAGIHWALILKEAGNDTPIGCISVQLEEGKDTHRGFWLGLPWQRRGLMTEAANTVNDYWFNVLQRPHMRIYNAVDNEASSRIKRSSGFTFIGEKEHRFVSGPGKSEIWEITREAWQAKRPHPPRML